MSIDDRVLTYLLIVKRQIEAITDRELPGSINPIPDDEVDPDVIKRWSNIQAMAAEEEGRIWGFVAPPPVLSVRLGKHLIDKGVYGTVTFPFIK